MKTLSTDMRFASAVLRLGHGTRMEDQAVLREVQRRQADDDHADDRHRFEHLPQSGFV